MYKVFLNDIALYLVESTNNLPKEFTGKEIKLNSITDFENFNISESSYILCKNIIEVKNKIFNNYIDIAAAGGLVENKEGKFLFIYRLGKWDIPKGKIELNEEIRSAAIREVEEECGISNPAITGQLPSTFHTYSRKGKKYLKRTYWFNMSYSGSEKVIPQLEENITKVEWLGKKQFNKIKENTYLSIIDVLNHI